MSLTTQHGLPLPDDDGQALLLLCTTLAWPSDGDLKPLKPSQYAALERQLTAHGLDGPGALLDCSVDELQELELDEDTATQISRLLHRSGPLAMAVQAMADKGLWVLPRTDPRYPSLLRERLDSQAPAALFGAGEAALLQSDGLAVVGSREADEPACAAARRLGDAAAGAGLTLISGAARGIDREAMNAALEAGGVTLGVLPADLERTALTREHRALIADQRLMLCSADPPEARWQTWRAMARNKLLYTLSQAAVVVHSSEGEGGTWQGATEALKAKWVPVWARQAEDAPKGNQKLIERGAQALDDAWLQRNPVEALFDQPTEPTGGQLSLFDDE